MKNMTSKDLTENLTLLLLEREEDGDGGFREEWKKGPHFWAALKPLSRNTFQVIAREDAPLSEKAHLLWKRRPKPKRLCIIGLPFLIQSNRFLKATAIEEPHA